MIICKACATRNADSAEFCASCGRYLEWSGEHVEPEPHPEEGPAGDPVPEVAEVRPGRVRRALVAMRLAHGPPPGSARAGAGEPGDAPPASTGTLTRPDHPANLPSPAPGETSTIDIAFALAGTPDREGDGPPQAPAAGPAVRPGLDDPAPRDDVTGFVPVTAVAGTPPAEVTIGVTGAPGTATSQAEAFGPDVRVTASVPAVAPRRPGELAGGTSLAVPGATDVPGLDFGDGVPAASPRRTTALRRPTEAETRPVRQRRRTPAVVVPEGPVAPSPGDIFCPRCNQFNAPSRVFCRRCGEVLRSPAADATLEYVPLSWWQRHFGSDVRVVGAGNRPGRWGKAVSGGGGQGWLMRVGARAGAVVIGVFVLLSFIGPAAQPLRNWYTGLYRSVMHKVNITYNQQFAIGANATSEVATHPAAYAVDDALNTWWQTADVKVPKAVKGKPKPKAPIPGVGEKLTVVFAEPTTINRIGVLSGAAGTPQAFLAEARPREVLLTFTGGYKVHEHLKDSQSFQQFGVDAKNATSMTLQVLSVYPSATGKAMALTELEFYQRQ